MKYYYKYIIFILVAFILQGCSFKHTADNVSINEIQDHRQLYIPTQDFYCQNAFSGSAHKFIVNQNDILKGYKVPVSSKVVVDDGTSFVLEDIKLNNNIIFLKLAKVMGHDTGFLIYPNGEFALEGSDQLSFALIKDKKPFFNNSITCHWDGTVPFKQLSKNMFESLKLK